MFMRERTCLSCMILCQIVNAVKSPCRLCPFLYSFMYSHSVSQRDPPRIQCLSSDAQSSNGQRKPSFNGELNGLLGTAGILGDLSTMSESTRPISTDLSITQETQVM